MVEYDVERKVVARGVDHGPTEGESRTIHNHHCRHGKLAIGETQARDKE